MTKTPEHRCGWHKCGAPFTPGAPHQRFCSEACRQQYGTWTRMRGGALVNLLLSDMPHGRMMEAIREAQAKLRAEVEIGLRNTHRR